jgi:hypothetical protein
MPPAEELHLEIELGQHREDVERAADIVSVDFVRIRAASGKFHFAAEIAAEAHAYGRGAAEAIVELDLAFLVIKRKRIIVGFIIEIEDFVQPAADRQIPLRRRGLHDWTHVDISRAGSCRSCGQQGSEQKSSR